MGRAFKIFGAGPLVLLFLLPLAASLVLLLPGLTDMGALNGIVAHPQFAGAFALTAFSGATATVLSIAFAIIITSALNDKVLQRAPVFLAVPHLALAMGLAFLIAPTGLIARIVATLFTGWTAPPLWQTTQDPYAVGLVAALVLKETPFLVWAFATVLQQDELRSRFQREATVARSLGHGPRSTFLRVLLPQILRRSIWPMIAVFSYGMTVVDMALVIGPTQPPTLAQLVWADLNDGEIAANARGAAGTFVLSLCVGLCLLVTWLLLRLCRPNYSNWLTKPARREIALPSSASALWNLFTLTYAVIVVALLLQSVSALWPFPRLLADNMSLRAWSRLVVDSRPLLTTLLLAISTSAVAVLACVGWFESKAEKRDKLVVPGAMLMLCLPILLIALGQYRLLLQLQLTGHWLGLFLVHLAPVTTYVFVMLKGPYRGYDLRWQQAALGLGKSRLDFLAHVKWPMLKAPLLSAFAVGFAVSVAQYVPAQLAAAGRYATLPMEAVTLSSGGNRALIAASALLLMVLPFIVFRMSAWFSRPRWNVM
jgi:putative thiamine transport system permease protein